MRIIPIAICFFSCAGYSPAPEWHSYRDIEQRNHIYNMDIEKLSLSGENLTEYYYCLTHERLEEIKVIWPLQKDSTMTDQP